MRIKLLDIFIRLPLHQLFRFLHRYRIIYFQMAEVAVPRELFMSILSRIGNLKLEVT